MTSEPNSPETPKPAFAKLLAIGLAGWLVGSLVLLGLAWPLAHVENIAIAAMWSISHWWIAFAFGAILLTAVGLASRQSFSSALKAYLLPMGFLTAIALICLSIYPDYGFKTDLFDFLPLVLVFYIFGFIWMSAIRSGTGNTAFVRTVLPAIVAGVVILGFIAVPVFKSNNFIYRNAFGLTVSKTAINNGILTADAVLEIHKPGSYDFSAPRYMYPNMDPGLDQETVELGKITWGKAGDPKEGASGTFPFQIRWEKNIPESIEKLQSFIPEENMIYLEVHNPKDTSKELIFNIPAAMPLGVN